MKFINENLYCHGTGKICYFLKKNGSPDGNSENIQMFVLNIIIIIIIRNLSNDMSKASSKMISPHTAI